MKKATIILCFAFAVSAAMSQDIVDPPKLFNKDTLSIYDKRPETFTIGWNWAGPVSKFDRTMNVTTYHEIPKYYKDGKWPIPYAIHNQILDSLKAIPCLWDVTDGRELCNRVHNSAMNGMSLFLEPSLPVDTSDNRPARWNDASGGVYGFRYHNWSVGDTAASGNDYSRFRLHAANVSTEPVVVLDSIFDDSILRYLDYDGTNDIYYDTNKVKHIELINENNDIALYHPFNGKQWYLSVNLRALNADSLERHLNDTILSVELPYIMENITDRERPLYSNGFVCFDSLSSTDTSLNRRIAGNYNNDFRGLYRALTKTAGKPTVFYITGNMLHVAAANPDSNSVTLSAFFKATGKVTLGVFDDNPHFKYDWWANPLNVRKYISSIDVRVKYYGKVDVGIDWLRFETPRTRKIFHGGSDMFLRRCLDTLFDYMARNPRHPRLYRIYGADELLPYQWGVGRYYNMLMDTLVSTEIYIEGNGFPNNPPERYLKATASKEMWSGSTFFHDVNWCAAPYIRKANVDWLLGQQANSFDANFGYAGNNFVSDSSTGLTPYSFSDTLNSAYETFVVKAVGSSPQNFPAHTVALPLSGEDLSVYDKITYSETSVYYPTLSTQSAIEKILYQNYYKYPKALFNDKPWWANLWPLGHLSYDSKDSTFVFSNRPKTGEEVRVQLFSPIILGAKGVMYYLKTRPRTSYLPKETDICFLEDDVEGDYDKEFEGEGFAYSNANGGDFIDFNVSSGYHFGICFDSTAYDWNMLGIDKKRIYIGIKSATVELYKTDYWIRAVESTLLNLRLKAWYGKGFLKLYSQSDEFAADTVLADYIDYTNTRTRKLFQPVEGIGNIVNEVYENYDSSFFDITLLQNNGRPLDTGFTVGLQNRRTDCLIYYYDSLNMMWELRFFTTAQMDSLCRFGGADPQGSSRIVYGAAHWRQYWWKRLGCRTIDLKFNYSNPIDTSEYCMLHVTELGKGTTLDNCWWRQEPYMQPIDTIIGQDDVLPVQMMPGDGKLLDVRILRVGKTEEGCSFCNSVVDGSIGISIEQAEEDCCWDLKYSNTGSCTFTNVPVSFTYPYSVGNNDISFESADSTAVIRSHHNIGKKVYTQTIDTLPGGAEGTIARICLSPDTFFDYSYSFGGLVNKNSCRMQGNGHLSCPVSDSLCCTDSHLGITAVDDSCGLVPVPGGSYNFYPCTYDFSFDSPYDSCYYDIAVRQEHSYGSDVELDSLNEVNVLLSDYEKEMCDPFDVKSSFKYSRRNITDTVCLKFYIISGSDTVCVKDSCRINYSQIDIYRPDELYNENIYSCDSICIGVPYAGKKENSAGESMSRQLSMTAVPNPFSSETNIEYYLPEASPVTFELYNSLGEKLFDMNEGIQEKGAHNIHLDCSMLPDGVYYLRLATCRGSRSIVLSMIK